MVKIKKTCLALCATLFLLSCTESRLEYDIEKYGDKENFAWDFSMLIEYYSGTYNKSPQNATDLLVYIERMDPDSRVISEDCNIYDPQYLYLKNNQDKLVFVTDSLLSIYYKRVKERNLLIRTPISNSCDLVDTPRADFFDKEELWIDCDTLSTEVINRLYREYWKYYYQTHNDSNGKTMFEKAKFEYRPDRLTDLCNGRVLEVNQSPFVRNTFGFLDSLARANNFSRIIVSGYIETSSGASL